MSKLKFTFNLFNYPPAVLVSKAQNKINDLIKDPALRKAYINNDLRSTEHAPISASYIDMGNLNLSGINLEAAQQLSKMYLAHRFDILGSGWTGNSYDHLSFGFEEYKYSMNIGINEFDDEGGWLDKLLLTAHREKSKQIWKFLNGTNNAYNPIDWQKDIKSGFRWNEKIWYKDQYKLIKRRKGVDIKIPWELARLHHLPQMAIFAKLLPDIRDALIKEFKCQVLDFFAANPVGMGVNWTSSMDIGIRTTNILVAYDLFRQLDTQGMLDEEFQHILSNSIFDHGDHIFNNLEYKESITTNHYLLNIAGLLFAHAYLEKTEITKSWFDFAKGEMWAEIQKQFLNDGGNFEASTSYHRLSTEMMIYSAAIVAATEKTNNPFPKKLFDKIGDAVSLLNGLTKKNGSIPQFGDNDSGRLFRFTPVGNLMKASEAKDLYLNLVNYEPIEPDELYWDQDQLDHRDLLSAAYAIFHKKELKSKSEQFPFEFSLLSSILGKYAPNISDEMIMRRMRIGPVPNESRYNYDMHSVLKPKADAGEGLTKGLHLLQYPESGIWIWRSPRLYLAISGCTSKKQQRRLGHSHNDKLSFELSIDGTDIIVDPGTYVYTASVDGRNEFRSVKAHSGMIVEGQEQNSWMNGEIGIFRMLSEAKCWVIDIQEQSIKFGLNYRGIKQIREFVIFDDKILVNDLSNVPFKLDFNMFRIYSNGYGKRLS